MPIPHLPRTALHCPNLHKLQRLSQDELHALHVASLLVVGSHRFHVALAPGGRHYAVVAASRGRDSRRSIELAGRVASILDRRRTQLSRPALVFRSMHAFRQACENAIAGDADALAVPRHPDAAKVPTLLGTDDIGVRIRCGRRSYLVRRDGTRIDVIRTDRCASRLARPWRAILKLLSRRSLTTRASHMRKLLNAAYEIRAMPTTQRAAAIAQSMRQGSPKNSLRGAWLLDRTFAGALLKGANLYGATLARCDFKETDLRHANLARSGMHEVWFRCSRCQHLDVSTTYLETVNFLQCDARNMIFDGCGGKNVQFHRCQLQQASFRDSCIRAEFHGCDIDMADFAGADLSHVSFYGCRIRRTIFDRANLDGARFVDTRLENTPLSWDQLTTAQWLNCMLIETDTHGAEVEAHRIGVPALDMAEEQEPAPAAAPDLELAVQAAVQAP